MDLYIEEIINNFIAFYKADSNIQAAILIGSYADGNYNKYSDIDILIVSSDDADSKEQGCKKISDKLIEYYIKPAKIIFAEIEESINFSLLIKKGEKIFDRGEIVNELKKKASVKIKKPFSKISAYEKNTIIRHVFNDFEQLKRAYGDNDNEFYFLYYLFLDYVIDSYGKYKGIVLPQKKKIYRYIFNGYTLSENLANISNNEFLLLLKECMRKDEISKMYKNVTNLKDYFINDMGGIEADNWSVKLLV